MNTETRKFLSVVCNKKNFTNRRSKAFGICKFGFKKDTLCYPKGLWNVITKFFGINISQEIKKSPQKDVIEQKPPEVIENPYQINLP